MQYNQLKTTYLDLRSAHPGYVWFVLELSMVCAAIYSLFGLFLASTGALVSGSTLRMVLGFMLAPLYALFLFVTVTLVLTAILTVPYVLLMQRLNPAPAKPNKRAPRKAKAPVRPRRTAPTK